MDTEIQLQCASDLHLERRSSRFLQLLKPSGDILILAGDIGYPGRKIYGQFLHWCSLKFKFVVLVPGNHEYYGSSVPKVNKILKQLCQKYGVYFLEKDILEISELGIVILGTTLWSNIPDNKACYISEAIEDYHAIKDFSPKISHELYLENREWLKTKIKFYRARNPEYSIVVITHHAPEMTNTINPRYRGFPDNCAFASDCTDIMEGVNLWIYGHTHYNNTFKIGSTTITSNQRGYPREFTGESYSKKFTIKMKKINSKIKKSE